MYRKKKKKISPLTTLTKIDENSIFIDFSKKKLKFELFKTCTIKKICGEDKTYTKL